MPASDLVFHAVQKLFLPAPILMLLLLIEANKIMAKQPDIPNIPTVPEFPYEPAEPELPSTTPVEPEIPNQPEQPEFPNRPMEPEIPPNPN